MPTELDLTPAARSILAVYRRATPEQVEEGHAWYATAHELARRLDPGNMSRASGVIAALSPRLRWEQNVTLAERAYADGAATGTLTRSCQAANAILGGADPLTVLNGPKVRAFYTLITDPHADVVVIDMHAIDIAVGRPLTDDVRSRLFPLARKGWYRRFEGCYRRARQHIPGKPPASWIQAATWTAWRTGLAKQFTVPLN